MTKKFVPLAHPGVKLLQSGKYKIGTKAGAQAARERIDVLSEELQALLADPEILKRQEAVQGLSEALDGYVLATSEASESIELGEWRYTKVVQHQRSWNPDKLMKLIPTSIYKMVIKVSVDSAKLDQLVREGKIDRKKIEAAYEETPKKPYVKATRASGNADAGEAEATSLAEVLR